MIGKKQFMITKGPHYGRTGLIVQRSLFGLRVTLNVQATDEETRAQYGEGWGDRVSELYGQAREWITVWKWQVKEDQRR